MEIRSGVPISILSAMSDDPGVIVQFNDNVKLRSHVITITRGNVPLVTARRSILVVTDHPVQHHIAIPIIVINIIRVPESDASVGDVMSP